MAKSKPVKIKPKVKPTKSNNKLKQKYNEHQSKLKAYDGISCIYVLRFNYPGKTLYKVGLAKNLAHRMRAYSTHNAIPPHIEDFYVIHDFNLLGTIEKAIHVALRAHLVRTEYFDCELEKIKDTVKKVSELIAGESYIGWSLDKPMLMDYVYWGVRRGVVYMGGLVRRLTGYTT